MQMNRQWWGALVLAATLISAAAPAWADGRVERPGTVGLSLGGAYGVLTGNSRLGLDFEAGLGYNVSLRYVLGRSWSLGLNFHNHTFDAVPDARPQGTDKLVVTNVSGQVYYYRNRSLDAAQYAVLGLGFYRPEIHLGEGEISFPGENLLVSAGIGAEVFIKENWGLDLGARAVGYFGEGIGDFEAGTISPDGNVAVGFHGQVAVLYYLLR